MASFTKEVNQRLAKRPLKTNRGLANRGLTSLVKEATGVHPMNYAHSSRFVMPVVVRYWPILPISFRVTSPPLVESYVYPSTSEVTLKDMGKFTARIHKVQKVMIWNIQPSVHWMEYTFDVRAIFLPVTCECKGVRSQYFIHSVIKPA